MSNSPRSKGRAPQRVDRLVGQRGSRLGRLLEHARDVAGIDRRVRQSLEPDLADHCEVANYHQGRLVVVCSSAAWATRWRMKQAEIIGRLQAARLDVRAVDVRISPVRRTKPEPRKRKPLPKAAREALERFAEDSGDPEIRALVRRAPPDANGE
jgi:hypothetical protein